ncbi:MAG: T9SS type A sorting domain-containing protein, partial [Bacteroidia bacterium]|nr:T9SS type A sorting domain-containing protein [Bacteroidia bacterium]
ASDDWNTKVDFKINSQPIGSIYSPAENPTISVNVSDPDGESVTSITVYYGVPGSGNQPAVLTTSNSNSLTYTHTITANSTYYYYLHIVQADGDNIWTSPIWYTRKASITANPPVTAFSLPATACVGDNISLSDISTNNPTTWSWTAIGANTPAFVTQHPVISYATAGVYTVSLIASNSIGTGLPVTHTITVTSCVTGSDNKTTLPNTFQVYPNPFTNEVTFSGLNFMKNKTLLIFNSIGKIVYQQLIGTDDRISLNLSQYADGVYFIKVDNYIKSIVKNSMSK